MATKAKTAKKTTSKTTESNELEHIKYTNELRAKIIDKLQANISELLEENRKLSYELNTLKSKEASRPWILRKLGL